VDAPDRRLGARHLACFPASIERTDGEHRVAIIRDLSESGVLLLVRTTKIDVGDKLLLQLYLTEDVDSFRPASGHVVRVEELGPSAPGPWIVRAAIHFDEPLSVSAEDLAAFRERLARLGIEG
jgi:hypothetical protein